MTFTHKILKSLSGVDFGRQLNFLHNIYKLEETIRYSSISEVLTSYIPYIEEEIQKEHKDGSKDGSKPLLIIFDIDDTLLDTSKLSKRFPLLDGLDPTITFYHFVKDIGYHTILLTARDESKRDITIQNLNRLNIKDYDDIIFRTNQDKKYSFGKYKLKQRKRLSKIYTIVANLGDQPTDFEGGYNGQIIQIPTF